MKPTEEYICNQTEPYKSILMHLQMVIERQIPEAELKYKYRIPYYYLKGRPFCYMSRSKDYIDLGFARGQSLNVYAEYLTTANRKVIKSLRYYKLEEINDEILVAVLLNASAIQN